MNHSAYPLQWPGGWPRTERREGGRFKTTLNAALTALKREVQLLGGTSLVLSSNVTLGSESPKDPGVVAYFVLREQAMAIPCDRWDRVESNVKAIALTIEAIRGMERWGAKDMITAMFQGFKALPQRSGPSPWDILGLQPGATEAQIMHAWRDKAKTAHADMGGSHEAMVALNEAKDIALTTARG